MSIATELARIQQAKADIKTAIEAKGVTVPSSATIDTYDDYVSQISGGSGISMPSNLSDVEFDENGNITSLTYTASSVSDSAYTANQVLTDVELADSVSYIGTYAFSSCPSLTSVTIGSGVTSIEFGAFENCNSLETVTVYATVPPYMYYGFGELGNYTIYVPEESVDAYKTEWSDYAEVIEAIS